MSSSTPKKRPKHKTNSHARSSSPPPASDSSLNSILEPPHSLFPSKDDFLRLIAVLAIATFVTVGCNFLATSLRNRQPKPFCDSGVESPDSLSDACESCPSNGQCYEGNLKCDRGYRKYGKLCMEDGDVNEIAKKLSEWVKFHICEENAQYLCDGTGRIWVKEDDIWNDLDGHKLMEHVGSDNAINTFIKEKTMEIIGKVLQSRKNPQGFKEIKCPDMLAEHYKPFSCRIYQLISNNSMLIFPVCALAVMCTLLLWKFRQRQYFSTRVDELYQQVCDILEENALMSKRGNGESESWVVASRLRDHLLSPKERKNPVLWKQVEELVQDDSRVDRYPKLVKGESKVVWEWQVEGSLSSGRKRKKDDASKLKSCEAMEANSDKHLRRLKADVYAAVPEELVGNSFVFCRFELGNFQMTNWLIGLGGRLKSEMDSRLASTESETAVNMALMLSWILLFPVSRSSDLRLEIFNFFAVSLLNRQSKPFCDSSLDFPDSISGGSFLFFRRSGKLDCDHGYRKHGEAMQLLPFELSCVQVDDVWNDLDGHMPASEVSIYIDCNTRKQCHAIYFSFVSYVLHLGE
ncbi:hypothetical protein FNV43_RR10216 [Rhamnella rubrinervis]|uniref:Man1/Src1-like C-terminal domain-containing protein n=1 Tax=Rhamnella rubrinervis TaxID=2594499 RepID=A0A8K0HCT8_9ROSA|nr:hypothetical protein FNV43_RR10216 [Rhamnella rubrinervis]